MKRLCLILAMTLTLFGGCAKQKPVLEYRTIDSKSDARLKSAEGRNAVMDEMVKEGWQLQDPKMARGGSMVWVREKK